MDSTVHAVVQCLSVCHIGVLYCVKPMQLIIKQLALDFSLRTLAYGHQTWNMYLYGIPLIGSVK